MFDHSDGWTTGHIDERELQSLNLKQARIEIGQSLLDYSGKYGFVFS